MLLVNRFRIFFYENQKITKLIKKNFNYFLVFFITVSLSTTEGILSAFLTILDIISPYYWKLKGGEGTISTERLQGIVS